MWNGPLWHTVLQSSTIAWPSFHKRVSLSPGFAVRMLLIHVSCVFCRIYQTCIRVLAFVMNDVEADGFGPRTDIQNAHGSLEFVMPGFVE
jgi:hypothetical protein